MTATSPQLGQVQETLLIPLYFRAVESQRPDAIITDSYAVEIVEALDYDFAKFNHAWKVQLDVAIRTEIFDRLTKEFLTAHPSSIVVNLGAGLDGRFLRLDNGRVRWLDLDLPDAIALRRQFYTESERNQFLALSVLDTAWIDALAVRESDSVLLLAEGLFCYFTEAELKSLLRSLVDRLPDAQLVFQSISPEFVQQQHRVPAINSTQAVFRWGIESGRELESWDSRIKFIDEWAFIDQHPARWGLLRLARYWPPAYKKIRDVMKISHLRFRHS